MLCTTHGETTVQSDERNESCLTATLTAQVDFCAETGLASEHVPAVLKCVYGSHERIEESSYLH